MAIEKEIADTLKKINELFMKKEANYLLKLLKNPNYEDKDEQKSINSIKTKIRYLEKKYKEMTGESGKSGKSDNVEMMKKLNDIKSSVGLIVRSIPKD